MHRPRERARRLYAVADWRGPYPALLPGQGEVYGMAYETLPHFGREDLARMDAWEEFDPRRPATSLYHRRKVPIRLAGGEVLDADTYIYNRSLPKGAQGIADGDFRVWLTRTGAAAFGTRRIGGRCALT